MIPYIKNGKKKTEGRKQGRNKGKNKGRKEGRKGKYSLYLKKDILCVFKKSDQSRRHKELCPDRYSVTAFRKFYKIYCIRMHSNPT